MIYNNNSSNILTKEKLKQKNMIITVAHQNESNKHQISSIHRRKNIKYGLEGNSGWSLTPRPDLKEKNAERDYRSWSHA